MQPSQIKRQGKKLQRWNSDISYNSLSHNRSPQEVKPSLGSSSSSARASEAEDLETEVFEWSGGSGKTANTPTSIHAGDVHNYFTTNVYGSDAGYQGQDLAKDGDNLGVTEAKFIDAVERAARVVSGQLQTPIDIDRPIERVKLELSNEQEMSVSNDTFGRKRRSTSIFPTPRGNVEVEEVFSLAEKNAEEDALKMCNNADARKQYIQRHGNRVLVTGQAGMGKSTLARDLVQKLLERKMLPATDLIFFVQCKDIDFSETLGLLDFLLRYCVADGEDFAPNEKENILLLIKRCRNIVFILDGLDEVNNQEFLSAIPKFHFTGKVPAIFLLRSLLNGNLLPQAKVLVTSRPRQAFELEPQDRPRTIVKILGLNPSAQVELGKQICGTDCPRVHKILRQDPDLDSACYVPVFCTILYAVLHRHTASHGRGALNTMTRVMMYLLNTYLRSAHMRLINMEELVKIAKFSREGFASRKYVFHQSDISDAGITGSAFQAFMYTYLDNDTKLKFRIFEGEHRCSFTHQIWQEFFTAIDLIFFSEQKDYDAYETALFEDYRWDVVAKFAFGLTDTSNMESFKQNFRNWSQRQTNWKKRSSLLKVSAECRMSQAAKDSFSLLKLSGLIREADDQAFTLKAAKRLPHTIKIDGSHEPVTVYNNDINSIMRLLEAALYADEYPIKTIDFDQVEFSGDSFKLLASEISSRNIQIPELRLVSCWLGAGISSSLITLLQHFERIHIAYVDISPSDICLLKDYYANMPPTRPEVYLFLQDEACDFKYDLKRKEKKACEANAEQQ